MMGATKAPMPKEKWMVCMNGPESNPCQLSKQRALPPEIRTTLYGLVFLKWAIPSLFLFIFVFSIQFTGNRWYKVCRRLDLNWGPLVLEATALPTEPQPLPLLRTVIACGLQQKESPELASNKIVFEVSNPSN